MTFEFMWGVLTFCFVMSAVPGPNNTIAFSAGLNYGFLSTVPYIFAASASISLMFAAAAWGLGEFFAAFPEFYGYLRYAGIAYILYLAWKVAASPVRGANDDSGPAAPTRRPTFLNGVLFQLVNPKAWIFAITGIATYMGRDMLPVRLLFLCVTFAVTCFIGILTWSLIGRLSGRLVRSPRVHRAINLCMGLLLASSVLTLF